MIESHEAQPGLHTSVSDELIRLVDDARRHPLGLEFLQQGDLGAVAITFGVHAFTVEAARAALSGDSLIGKGAADGLS